MSDTTEQPTIKVIVPAPVDTTEQPTTKVFVPAPVELKENAYPRDSLGRPDLAYYCDPLEYYIQMCEQYFDGFAKYEHASALDEQIFNDLTLRYDKFVQGQWGLIAKGTAAIPYALSLLQRSHSDAREVGASILAGLGGDDRVVDAVFDALKPETDIVARDALITALGRFKAKKAIPVLADIIRNETDGDSRLNAVESLGLIVRKRFLKLEDPIRAAIEWLDSH
jgi:hypothetical protein